MSERKMLSVVAQNTFENIVGMETAKLYKKKKLLH